MSDGPPRPSIGLPLRRVLIATFTLTLALTACQSEPLPSGFRTVAVAFEVGDATPSPQGVPLGSTPAVIAVRVIRSDVLAAYDAALATDPAAPEPVHAADDPHPVFGVGVPKRIRFDAQGNQNELGATTLYLLAPDGTLQLAFRSDAVDGSTEVPADLTLVATVFATDVVPEGSEFPSGAVLAVGTLALPFATDPDSIATSVRVPLRSVASAGARLTPRLGIDAVYPGRTIDFDLTVLAAVDGGSLPVPTGDYTASAYTLGAATLHPTFADTPLERARGVRVIAGDPTLPAALTVAATIDALDVAGTPPVYARAVALPVSASIPFGGDGFEFDTTAPTLSVDAAVTQSALTGTTSDEEGGSGVAALRVFDGPRLLASSLPAESDRADVAAIALTDGAFTAPLTELDASTGDAYLITVIAGDVEGNQARISGVVDLTAGTFVQTDPELP